MQPLAPPATSQEAMPSDIGPAETPDTLSCIHCGAAVNTAYCGNCGQRKGVAKLSWASLLHELGTRWLGLDNQFARTFVNLTIRPGNVIKCYLNGDRVRYLGPFAYYIITTAVVLLLISLLGVNMEDLMKSNNQSLGINSGASDRVAEMQARVLHYVAMAFRFISIAILPFFALALMWVYRSRKLNFIEHSVIMLYALAHMFWLSLAQALAFKFTGNSYTLVAFFIMLPYSGFLFMDSLETTRSFKKWLRGVWAYLLGYILFLLSIMIFSLILGNAIRIYMTYQGH